MAVRGEADGLLMGPGGSIAIAISVDSGNESGGTFSVAAGDSSGESGGISRKIVVLKFENNIYNL